MLAYIRGVRKKKNICFLKNYRLHKVKSVASHKCVQIFEFTRENYIDNAFLLCYIPPNILGGGDMSVRFAYPLRPLVAILAVTMTFVALACGGGEEAAAPACAWLGVSGGPAL